MQMWLVLFMCRYKWYQNNLVTPCGIGALHDVAPVRTSQI
jgi:hypothetical protein